MNAKRMLLRALLAGLMAWVGAWSQAQAQDDGYDDYDYYPRRPRARLTASEEIPPPTPRPRADGQSSRRMRSTYVAPPEPAYEAEGSWLEMMNDGYFFAPPPYGDYEPYSWQWLPDGVLYHSYLAGPREPRAASQFLHLNDHGWVWDIALGGRVGLLRYGTQGSRPEGFEIDFEGAALPRLDLESEQDLMSVDFRAGLPITWSSGPLQIKTGYYHLSSHLGDEFIDNNPGIDRRNYSRDAVMLGVGVFPWDDVRLYGETAYALQNGGGSEPWEFQLGAEYSPRAACDARGRPFAAVNAHLREENDFQPDVTAQAGWQWRGRNEGSIFRLGLHYYNGKSPQYQFLNEHEELFGFAAWYDF